MGSWMCDCGVYSSDLVSTCVVVDGWTPLLPIDPIPGETSLAELSPRVLKDGTRRVNLAKLDISKQFLSAR